MTLFWIASIILVVFSCILIALPMMRQKANNDEALRDELNKAFYKDRLNELEKEATEGLVENQQDLIDDLKQSLLDDIPEEKKQASNGRVSPLAVLIPSIILIVVVSYGMYFKFGAQQDVRKWQEVTSNLPALSKKLISPDGVELSDDEMQDLTLALRTRLFHEPEDSTGWLLLGRIALANRDVDTAIGAMKNAFELDPENDDVMLGYAQGLMLSQDEMDQDNARRILGRLVQKDYVDLRVFSLLAFDAFERQDYPAAVRYWSIMQKMVGPEDSRYEMLGRSIENAQAQMDQKGSSEKSVAVTINIADDVVADPNAALIVSVHTADGSPMPVAAARYPMSSLPRTVVLDDGNSMIAERKLSSLDTLIVRARIDHDGNVATKDGDWFGESKAVKIGEPVEVLIDKRY